MKPLNKKQEAFAQAVGIRGISHSDAYRENYAVETWNEKSVHVAASKLAAKANVAQRIKDLRAQTASEVVGSATFDVKKLFEIYLEIATADPDDLISLRVGACRYCHGEGHQYQWREREYIEAVAKWERKQDGPLPDVAGGFGYLHTADPHPNCPECGGEGLERVVPRDSRKFSKGARSLYRGAEQKKDGIKVSIADKDKALDQIGRILGAFDDKLRVDLAAQVASYKLDTTDPAAAAEAYRKMLDGGVK